MNNEKVKFLLNWNHFGEHLSSCMTKLMTDSSYSDIIIATADKRMIYSHRFVLANSSKYFQRLFRHVNRQKGIPQLVVALPEIKYEIFKILMNYMYKGETQVPHELLPSVIKAGQFLEINGLVNLNENESGGSGENSSKHFPRETHAKSSTMHSSVSGNESKQFKRLPSTLRDNVHTRENSHSSTKSALQGEKSKRTNAINDTSSRSANAEENGKENRSKLSRTLKCKNLTREKKEIIHMLAKRKSFSRDSVKKSSASSPSSSLSSESYPPKKLPKIRSNSQEILQVKVKKEKDNGKSLTHENENQEIQEKEERITIKMEVPDDFGEVAYTELQCDYCHEMYTKPSDWVRHMSDQHKDRGYQTYKELNKSVGNNTGITCVLCSEVCFTSAEWAKHLRMWHSGMELAVTNMSDTKKNISKVKRKSEKKIP